MARPHVAQKVYETTKTATAGLFKFFAPVAGTIKGFRVKADTGPTGSAANFDLNKNGSSVLGSPLQIASGQNTGSVALNVAVAQYDEITVDLDSTPNAIGADLDIQVEIEETGASATDAELRDRSTHTGTQDASTVTGLSEVIDDRVNGLIVAGAGISKTYDDPANTLTLAVSAASPTVKGAHVERSGDYTLPKNATTAIPWNSEVRDDDNYYAGGSPTRLTVSRANWYAIHCSTKIALTDTNQNLRTLRLRKNGSVFLGAGDQDYTPGSGGVENGLRLEADALVYLSPNDYIEAVYTHASTLADDTLTASSESFFTIVEVGALLAGGAFTIEEADGSPAVSGFTKIRVGNGDLTDEGGGVLRLKTAADAVLNTSVLACRAKRSTTQGISQNTDTAIQLNAEDRDDGGFHDNSTNNTRMTIPSGKDGWYVMIGGIRWAGNSTAGFHDAWVRKNGTTELSHDRRSAHTTGSPANFSPAVAVAYLVAGDYVELMAHQNRVASLNVEDTGDGTWFAIAALAGGGGGGSSALTVQKGGVAQGTRPKINLIEGSNVTLLVSDDSGNDRVNITINAGTSGTADTAPADIYIATTGSDTTGDGTSGNPYATLAKALSLLPDFLQVDHTIHVADGTYAEKIEVRRFISRPNTRLIITGNPTTPANVSFTGTVSHTWNGLTYTTTALITGPVRAELEGLRTNATADIGIWANARAEVIVDRCTVNGTLTYGIFVGYFSRIEFQGNVTVSGWSSSGLELGYQSQAAYTSAGTLTITGPGTSGIGLHITNQSHFSIWSVHPSGLNITVTGVKYGFQMGFQSSFTHQGPSATITVDNASKPANSAGVHGTDHSSWSSTCALVFDQLTSAIELNSISYGESSGTRTWTNLTQNTLVSQNSVALLA